MSPLDYDARIPAWTPLDAPADETGPESDRVSDLANVIPLHPEAPGLFTGSRAERSLRLGFVPGDGACPDCGSGLIGEDGGCGLCGSNVKTLLRQSVEHLDVSRASEEDQPRLVLKALDRARYRRTPLLRIIHGQEKGAIVRQLGWVLMERGDLKNWVIGEVLGDSVPVGKEFGRTWPVLIWSSDWNARNDAVTWYWVG